MPWEKEYKTLEEGIKTFDQYLGEIRVRKKYTIYMLALSGRNIKFQTIK